MKEFIGWAFFVGGFVSSYNNNRSLGMWFILLGSLQFIHADIDKIKKGMNL